MIASSSASISTPWESLLIEVNTFSQWRGLLAHEAADGVFKHLRVVTFLQKLHPI
jgi:hypothetical protein